MFTLVSDYTKFAIFALIYAFSAPLARAGDVQIWNRLESCATITLMSTSTQGNVVLANTKVDLKTPIGDCGCMSGLARYTSSIDDHGAREVLQMGVVVLMSSEKKLLF
jgi:hypothetical protein